VELADNREKWLSKTFSDTNPKQIKIYGGNITRMYCYGIGLTALDASRNTTLKGMDCRGNQLTADALNNLFSTLHDNYFQKRISIDFNPGSAHCDPRIAEAKDWDVSGYEGAPLESNFLKTSPNISIITWIEEHETFFNDYPLYYDVDINNEFASAAIIANKTVKDFRLYRLFSYDNRFDIETDTSFQLDELTPEKPVVVGHIDSTEPMYSYVDENNVRRFYIPKMIASRQKDILIEFFPDKYNYQ